MSSNLTEPPKPIDCVCGKTYLVTMKGRTSVCPHCNHIWDFIPPPDDRRRIGCDCEWCRKNTSNRAFEIFNKLK